MSNKLRLLLAQLNPTVGDLEKNAELLINTYQDAKDLDVDLIAFPEMFLTGYQIQDLVLKPSFQNDILRYLDLLVGECSGQISILFGAPILEKNNLYNSYLQIIDGKINVISTKKNLPNFDIFDENRYFKSGNLANIVNVKGVNIGCPICEDIWNGYTTKILKKKGASLILSPNGSPYEREKIALRHKVIRERCMETKLPVIYLNLVGGQDDQVFDGGTFAMNEKGDLKLQLPQFEEKKVVFELDEVTSLSRPKNKMIYHLGNKLAQDYRAITEGTKDYVVKSGFKKVLLGLSGGIDSALVATLAVDAIGSENVLCVRLPSQFSSGGSLNDAEELTKKLGCEIKTIPINKPFQTILDILSPEFKGTIQDLTEENIQSRIRGLILMALSNKFGSMLLTTGNKSEVAVGYSTIYGDMCGGYNPIKDLYKTKLYDLCDWRNSNKESWMKGPNGKVIPKKIILKPPSAELRPDQKDEDSLPPYNILDLILESLIEKDMSVREIANLGIALNTIKKVEKLVYQSEHKRFQSSPGVHLTKGSFWLGRRYPIVQNWREPS